eukprot:XP_011680848.1 PREDICTED: uncharacterized protein LOC574949 isoform X2 [Strongylocentrotus purpuratus]
MAMMDRRTLYGTSQRSTTISKSPEKEATVTELTWVDTTHKISEIVSRSPPLLPILIKCAALSSDPYIAAKIQTGDIMKLSRLNTVDIVQATVEFKSVAAQHLKELDDYNGVQLPSYLAIPKSMESITFEVVRGSVRYSTPLGLHEGLSPFSSKTSTLKANQNSVRFKTVLALSKQLPRFVKVIKTSKQIRHNTKIVDGHVLEIMGVHTPWATRDKFLSCRIDQPDGQVCKLDLKWRGTFDTIPDTKRYNIQDLLRVYRFPITVRVRDFSPTEWIPQHTSSQLKAIKTLDLNLTIEKEETVEFAMAISQTPPSSMAGACQDPHDFKLLVLSKNIDVDFVTSSDMTMNPKVYAEVMNRMGGIGDSMISTVSKDIYLNEYGSPMAVAVPYLQLQPKVYGTPVRGAVADHDAISEHIPEIEEEDPYEPLSAIQKNAERERCESLLRGEGLVDDSQSQEDESSTDYTILRAPSALGIFPSNFGRLRQVMTDTTSYYQVPKNSADDDIYIVEDHEEYAGHRFEDEELDTPGTAGNFQGRKTLGSRCSDSLPRDAPPPIPNRSSLRHKTLDRTESTPTHARGLPQNTTHTLGPSMKIGSTPPAASAAPGLSYRKSLAGHKLFADNKMSSMLLEMRARQSKVIEAARDESETVAAIPEVQPIDDIPPPLPPPRETIDECYDDVVLPPPPPPLPAGSPPLPSLSREDDLSNYARFPVADFPPPLPERSPSLASLSSLASMTSASAASLDSATSMKSAASITSIDSVTSLSSTVSAPENHCFQDSLKTLKPNMNGNFFPTLPYKRPATRVGSSTLGRSQSCSPHTLRNHAAANRELPPLPIPEQRSEVPSITDYTFSEPTRTSRGPRPSSSGNILDEGRDAPPRRSTDRALSMENLLHHDGDDDGKQSVPPTPPRTSSKPFVTSKGRRSYFAPNRGRPKTPNPCGQIPVANISPRPSPLDSMLLSLTKSRDGALPRPPDVSTTWHVTSPESSDDADDDDDYEHPQMGYDDARSYISERVGRNTPTPPTVPKRFIPKKSASLPRNGIKSIKDIPVDIATLSCDQIAKALGLLNIREDIIENLRSVQMNGELLQSMSEEILRTEFQMSQFHAIKVIKFVNGWRP